MIARNSSPGVEGLWLDRAEDLSLRSNVDDKCNRMLILIVFSGMIGSGSSCKSKRLARHTG